MCSQRSLQILLELRLGAEISAWDGKSMDEAISEIEPFFGPYSTDHHKRFEQLVFLTRVAPEEQVEIAFQNPGDDEVQNA